jgi:hypothetical protein
MCPDFKMPLGSLSQEDSQPWHCIRCGETKKFEDASFMPWVLSVLRNTMHFVLGSKQFLQHSLKPCSFELTNGQAKPFWLSWGLIHNLFLSQNQQILSPEGNMPCAVAALSSSCCELESTVGHALVGRNHLVRTLCCSQATGKEVSVLGLGCLPPLLRLTVVSSGLPPPFMLLACGTNRPSLPPSPSRPHYKQIRSG